MRVSGYNLAFRSNEMAFGAVAAALLVTSFVACDGPTKPASLLPPPNGDSPPTVRAVRVELSVPASIAPGEAVQLTANAAKADGSVDNVTSRTVWRSSNPHVLEVSDAGLARGITAGEAAIIGRVDTLSATVQTLVVPQGTYRLIGRVSVGTVPISGVLLTVVSGIGDGLTAVSSADGGYALYGVSGPIRLQAKKEGFANRTESLDVSDHRTFDVGMGFDGRAPEVTGTYTLTIAAGPCQPLTATLPDAARSRSYTAQLSQQGAGLIVDLSGANFILSGSDGNRGKSFRGFIDPSGAVTFEIVGDLNHDQRSVLLVGRA